MTYSNSEQFFKAKEKVALLQNDPGNEAKLKLYALFKQVKLILKFHFIL